MVSMTVARSQLIDRENGGFHHIVSRCVRRAWLCGLDPLTGRDFSHRKRWIEERLLTLASAFAVRVYSYAVMSNHCHIVLEYRPRDALGYSDEEVARRWLVAYPPRRAGQLELRVQALLEDPERIAKLRGRLGDLSWYMKCLNEAIARRSNREDDCTGRFWEGRFNSSRPMESLAALYPCMTYVDLNPLRAGATGRVAEAGEHTSLRRRIEEARREERKFGEAMAPMGINGESRRIFTGGDTRLSLTLRDYLAHVEWTSGRGARPTGECAEPRLGAPPSLADPEAFLARLRSFHRRWSRKLGRGDTPLPGYKRPESGALAATA